MSIELNEYNVSEVILNLAFLHPPKAYLISNKLLFLALEKNYKIHIVTEHLVNVPFSKEKEKAFLMK